MHPGDDYRGGRQVFDAAMADSSAPEDDANLPLVAASSLGDTDADSAVDIPTDERLSTGSLQANIYEYYLENGRTYHAFSRDKYVLPNDEDENERLDIQNHHFLLTFDGRLCFAPGAATAQRVLDAGTGTGIWAMDFADEHPHAAVIGVDLSPIQPEFGPPNCRFEIADLEEEWTWSHPFDYVFTRMMAGSFGDWDKYMRRAYNNLVPGGWLEIIDTVCPVESDDDSLHESHAISRWMNLLIQGSTALGRPLTDPLYHRGRLQDAGFTNIEQRLYKWPTNSWPRDKKHKEIGLWTLANIDRGLEGISMAVLTRGCGFTQQEVVTLLAEVRRDMRNPRIHAYWPVVVVYGQKPEL